MLSSCVRFVATGRITLCSLVYNASNVLGSTKSQDTLGCLGRLMLCTCLLLLKTLKTGVCFTPYNL